MIRLLATAVGLWLVTACTAQDIHETAPSEIRGVWLTNVDSEIMFERKYTAEAMEYLAERGFNVVFPVVWNGGYTLYPSNVMEEYFGYDYGIHPDFAGEERDPLEDIIVEAHRHGMEVIPWFEYGFASSHEQDGGHIIEAYPHWAARDSAGNLLEKNGFEWMNAIKPEVQDFVLELVEEVMIKYDIDGIQGDDRLPAMPAEGGYSDYTSRLYEEETGNKPPLDPREDQFLDWKADRLSDFGTRFYNSVKSFDEQLIVSLSPSIYPWSKNEYLQDWPEWVRRGNLDILHPQVYRYDIEEYLDALNDQQSYFESARADLRQTASEKAIYHAPGVLIKVANRYNGPAYVNHALNYHRETGLDGEVFFFYEGLHEENENLGDTLAVNHYREPATLPYRPEPRRTEPYLFAPDDLTDLPQATQTIEGSISREVMITDRREEVTFQPEITEPGTYLLYKHLPFGLSDENLNKLDMNLLKNDQRLQQLNSQTPEIHHRGWIPAGKTEIYEDDINIITLKGDNLVFDSLMFIPEITNP